jgi:hypothetical protein
LEFPVIQGYENAGMTAVIDGNGKFAEFEKIPLHAGKRKA